MRLFQSLSRASLSLTAMLAMTSASQAVIVLGNGETVNLAALMATGSDRKFIVDDKLFTFKYVTTPSWDINQFDVTGYISANTNQYGLRNVGFDLTGPFVDGGINDQVVHDLNLNYTVEILPEYWERACACRTRAWPSMARPPAPARSPAWRRPCSRPTPAPCWAT